MRAKLGSFDDWEVEIKVRRRGRLWRRESGLGDTPLFAFETATNDLVRELQSMEERYVE